MSYEVHLLNIVTIDDEELLSEYSANLNFIYERHKYEEITEEIDNKAHQKLDVNSYGYVLSNHIDQLDDNIAEKLDKYCPNVVILNDGYVSYIGTLSSYDKDNLLEIAMAYYIVDGVIPIGPLLNALCEATNDMELIKEAKERQASILTRFLERLDN